MKLIASQDNARFKALQRLAHSSRERKLLGLSLLDGIHLVAAYRATVGAPQELVLSESSSEDPEIRSLLAAGSTPVPVMLTDSLFKSLSTVATPTGIMAVVPTPRPTPTYPVSETSLLLDSVQDPGNLGSVLRTAAAAGVRHVFLSPHTVHAWSPRVLRAGMGAHFLLNIYEQCDLNTVMRGFMGRVIAASQRATRSLFDADLAGPIALLLGNEGGGLSASMEAQAQESIAIPMPGGTESLNVAAAAAICLYEYVRQNARKLEASQ